MRLHVISKVSKRSATLKFQVKLHVCNLILALECLSAFCNVQLDYLFIDLQICGLFFFFRVRNIIDVGVVIPLVDNK